MTKYFDFDLKENYGVQICTSGTRPTAYEGRHIYETDTNKTLVCTNVTGPVWEEISIVWNEQSFTNLLKNGDFESWSAGAASAPDGWTTPFTGNSASREADPIFGTYCAEFVNDGSGGDDRLCRTAISLIAGTEYTVSFWMKSISGDTTLDIYIHDAVKGSITVTASWVWYTATFTASTTETTYLDFGDASGGAATIRIDGIILVEGSICPAFSPRPLVDDGKSIQIDSTTNAVTIGRDPTADAEAATKKYVDDTVGGGGDFKADGSVPMTGNLQMGDNDITGANAVQATTSQDLTLKVSTGQSIIFQAV